MAVGIREKAGVDYGISVTGIAGPGGGTGQEIFDINCRGTINVYQAAAAEGIKRLALYHLVPAPPNALAERMFLRGLPDDVILARDPEARRLLDLKGCSGMMW